jgi:hypothetical protein
VGSAFGFHPRNDRTVRARGAYTQPWRAVYRETKGQRNVVKLDGGYNCALQALQILT